METEKLHLLTVILLITTGVLHVIQPLIYGTNFETIGQAVFGVIYLSLGVLLQILPENKLIAILSIILPGIGMIIATAMIILVFQIFLFILVLFDYVIVPVRIYLYKENF